jgi:hypothetical protein
VHQDGRTQVTQWDVPGSPQSRTTNTFPGDANNEVDDFDRRCAVLLCQRHASGCRSRLLRSGQHLLCTGPRADVLCAGPRAVVLRSGHELLRTHSLLQAQVLQNQVLQAQVLQTQVLPLELQQLLRSRCSDLLRPGPDMRRACRADLRRSRCELLQLVR